MLPLKPLFFDAHGSAGKKFATSAAILELISVVSADLMSRLVDKGALLTIGVASSEHNLDRLGGAVLGGETNSLITKMVGSVGVDINPTASIPSPRSISRCDDSGRAALMTRSIGMEGTTTTPIAPPREACN